MQDYDPIMEALNEEFFNEKENDDVDNFNCNNYLTGFKCNPEKKEEYLADFGLVSKPVITNIVREKVILRSNNIRNRKADEIKTYEIDNIVDDLPLEQPCFGQPTEAVSKNMTNSLRPDNFFDKLKALNQWDVASRQALDKTTRGKSSIFYNYNPTYKTKISKLYFNISYKLPSDEDCVRELINMLGFNDLQDGDLRMIVPGYYNEVHLAWRENYVVLCTALECYRKRKIPAPYVVMNTYSMDQCVYYFKDWQQARIKAIALADRNDKIVINLINEPLTYSRMPPRKPANRLMMSLAKKGTLREAVGKKRGRKKYKKQMLELSENAEGDCSED